MKRIVVLILLLTATLVGYSQDDDNGTIDAQRPTLTESYSILVPGITQFENGLDYFEKSGTTSIGTFFRGSVTSRVELRVFTDYTELNTVGAKFILREPPVHNTSGVGMSFMYNRDFSNNSNDYRVALTKDFHKVFMTYNLGYNGDVYNIVLLGVPIIDEVNYFVEYYNDPSINRMHTGFTWILKRDIQFDINGGWMDTDEWYAGFGVSFRI